ncbi:MAG: GAF domain-containing protein [Calditrichaceae bacterium]|nr:GAF domain-containing protein [Calditrichaceae bacterium]MBN2707649.1 GAF domain-containing protein [Calditrichaceae bacterium]RQV93181.1 MAG: GAF domain-containing protein [Calditrichota bacterium]
MVEPEIISKQIIYDLLLRQTEKLLDSELDIIANMANFSALIYDSLADINWAGFYRLVGDKLILGPFQGKPACVRISLGRGVCGTAAQNKKAIIAKNVNEFPGHITCDPASRSEIVIPLIKENKLIGVLDIDSPKLARFDQEDQKGLEALIKVLLEKTII